MDRWFEFLKKLDSSTTRDRLRERRDAWIDGIAITVVGGLIVLWIGKWFGLV